jgi:enoyl-CoA hydratase/carnithine racemase
VGKIRDSFYRLGQVRVPTVAAVRGSAVAAGMNMLLVPICDGGAGRTAAVRVPQARDAPRWRGVRDPFVALFGEEINGDKAVDLGLAWRRLTTPLWRTGRWRCLRAWQLTPSRRRSPSGTSATQSSRARPAVTSRRSTSAARRCGRCAAGQHHTDFDPGFSIRRRTTVRIAPA